MLDVREAPKQKGVQLKLQVKSKSIKKKSPPRQLDIETAVKLLALFPQQGLPKEKRER